MANFFIQPTHAISRDGLAITRLTKKMFDAENEDHLALLKDCTQTLRLTLQHLKALDRKMTIGFSLGLGFFSLAGILPGFFVAAATCFAYSAYLLGTRKNLYQEYNLALQNLMKCCVWSLPYFNYAEPQQGASPPIMDMITTLSPVVSLPQLRMFINNEVSYENSQAAQYKASLLTYAEHLNNFLAPTPNASYAYKVYGYGEGGFFDILQGIGYAIKESLSAVKDSITHPMRSMPGFQ